MKLKIFKKKTEHKRPEPTAICGWCEGGVFARQPRQCSGCDLIICYRCWYANNVGRKISVWCEDCWEILELPTKKSVPPRGSLASDKYDYINKRLRSRLARPKTKKKKKRGLFAGLMRSPKRGKKKNKWIPEAYDQSKFDYIQPKMVKAFHNLPQTEDFYPDIDEDVFWKIIECFMNHPHLEIAGVAVWDEESNRITWATIDEEADMAPSLVKSNRGHLTVEAIVAGAGVPNVQWHTHPGFSVFFSGTDTTDQMEFCEDAMKINPTGYHVFLVLDRLSWKIVRVDWKDGKLLSKRNGYVVVRNVLLHFDKNRYITYTMPKSNGVVYPAALGQQKLLSATSQLPLTDPLKKWDETLASLDSVEEPEVFENEWGERFTENSRGFIVKIEEEADDPLIPYPTPALDPKEEYFLRKGRFVGQWSDKDDDYAPLFKKMGVAVGLWKKLYDDIDTVYGRSHYRSIIEHRLLWEKLPDHSKEAPDGL